MRLPAGDTQLVQIRDAALTDAARRAGAWLACRPGCTQCCHGAFAINALDGARLTMGMQILRAQDPEKARVVTERAQAWIAEYGGGVSGDTSTGGMGSLGEGEA